MKKIWQKSLASMVSAALCLTAFVGCLTVNAATTYEGTITSKGATVTTDDAQATVTLTLSSENAMNAAAIKVSTKYGKLASVNVGDYKEDNYKIEEGYVVLDTGKLFVEAIDNNAGFTTAKVVLTFDKAADVAEGTYPVTVSAFAGETAATWNEDIVNLAVTGEINITVNAATTDPEHIDFTIRTPVLQVQEKYGFRIRIDKDSLPANCDHYEILLETQKYTGSNYALVDAEPTVFLSSERDSSSTTTRDYYFYKNVAAYALNLPISLTVKFYDAENNYFAYSNTSLCKSSPIEYLSNSSN